MSVSSLVACEVIVEYQLSFELSLNNCAGYRVLRKTEESTLGSVDSKGCAKPPNTVADISKRSSEVLIAFYVLNLFGPVQTLSHEFACLVHYLNLVNLRTTNDPVG